MKKILRYKKCYLPAISGVVTTAAIGKPLPMPLAIVTISGIAL